METRDQYLETFVVGRDMRNVYRRLFHKYPKGFPEIVVVNDISSDIVGHDIPDGIQIVRRKFPDGGSALIVSDCTDDEMVSRICDELDNPHCQAINNDKLIPFHKLTDEQIALRLICACYIADSLEIILEPIFFGGDGKDFVDELVCSTPFSDTIDMQKSIEEIASELRFNWQIKTFSQMYEELISTDDETAYICHPLSILDRKAFVKKLMYSINFNGYRASRVYPSRFDSLIDYDIDKKASDIDLHITDEQLKQLKILYKIGVQKSERW